MSASLIMQKALGARFVADIGVSALVPVTNIVGMGAFPERLPAIVIGDDQEVAVDSVQRHFTVFSTIHVWVAEPGLDYTKSVAGTIRSAIRRTVPLPQVTGGRILGWHYQGARFMRDPNGKYAHGVVTIEGTVELPE